MRYVTIKRSDSTIRVFFDLIIVYILLELSYFFVCIHKGFCA